MHRVPTPDRQDFVPTPLGWVAIIVTTCVLGLLFWDQGEEFGVPYWPVLSLAIGYFIAMVGWTEIRREVDERRK